MWFLSPDCEKESQMADGTFALLLAVAGLTDMAINHCGTEAGCLGRAGVDPRLAFSAGQVVYQEQGIGTEFYVRRDLGYNRGPFGFTFGLSATDQGSLWAGFGQTYRVTPNDSRLLVELHAMAGLYRAGSGVDLGGPIEFRSGIEVGYESADGWRFGLSYDHRSNAGLYESNLGLETLQIRVSVPTR